LKKVTEKNFQTILASPWYLNVIYYGVDWDRAYKNDPQDFDGTEEQKQLVIGGSAAMWGEYVDGTNILSRTWPRASAVGKFKIGAHVKILKIY
jgi:hexosaminidase